MAEAMEAAPSDAELVAGCRRGDPASWNALVERYSRYVSAIATQAFRLSPHDAEEVFQTVFLRVYERLGSLRSDDAVRPWLGQLTRNCCLDLLRASGRLVPVEEVEDQVEENAMGQIDEAMAIREALAHLSPECQEIIDRFFARDESYLTIGAALGIPSGTIASRISRCLRRLRIELEQ